MVQRIVLIAASIAVFMAASITLAAQTGITVGAQSRLWWSGPQVTMLGSPSSDGKVLSFADPISGELALRDLRGGSSKAIASRPSESREFAYFSVISRDGRSVAYAWSNDQGFYELRVASTSGGVPPVVVYRNPQAGFVQPCAWTPDNRQILALLFRKDNISQIALVPADGGTPRILRSLNWVYPKRMDLSPDGAWVVYDNFAAEGSAERSIFILSSDGSDERRLIDLPGNFLFPLWSPDGHRVYFAGDTGNTPELWAVDVASGRPRGVPYRVAANLGRFLPMGITAAGEYFYGVRSGSLDLFILSLRGQTHDLRRLATRFPGRNQAPAWSHDGKRIAYLSRRDTENFGEDSRAIVVQDLASGVEREVPAHMAHVERLAWSPDDASLLAAGSDGKGRSGLFLVRADSGVTTPVEAEHGAPFRGFEAVWPRAAHSIPGAHGIPDAHGIPEAYGIYYLHGEELLAHQLAGDREAVVLRAAGMRHLAVNPAGDTLAVGIGGNAIRLTPLASGSPALPGSPGARLIPFAGLRGIGWGTELLAVRGDGLWSVPVDGEGEPRLIARVPLLLPILAMSPDGREICVAAGSEQSEVRSLRLP